MIRAIESCRTLLIRQTRSGSFRYNPVMPPGKKPLPLFELVTDRENASRRDAVIAPPAPVRNVDFAPREPKPLIAEPRVVRSSEDGPKRVLPGLGGRPVVLSSTALWLAAAAILMIVFLVWMTGNAYGRRQAEQQFQRDFGQVGGAQPGPSTSVSRSIQDPLSTPAPASGSTGGPSAARRSNESTPPAADPGRVLTVSGTASDPRQAGSNYLLLGTLSAEETTAAIQFFAKNGVETIGVPVDAVDRRSVRANTSPRFQLFAAKGIPSAEFSSRQVERDRLKQEIVRLGAIWKKDQKGSTSFADAFWLKND